MVDNTYTYEPPKGTWIVERANEYSSKTYCSRCKSSAPFICKSRDHYGNSLYGEIEKTKFCPNCGAQMTESETK